MVKLTDITKSLISNTKTIFPNCKNYVGKLPEKAVYPCFLYCIGLNRHKINSYYTQKVTLNIDIVYFNTRDAYNTEDYMDKLNVINTLEEKFLSKYYLEVNNKNLDFNYDINESDGQIIINLRFDFFDLTNTEIQEQYEEIQEIMLNTTLNKKGW